jgi:hypothetical protein
MVEADRTISVAVNMHYSEDYVGLCMWPKSAVQSSPHLLLAGTTPHQTLQQHAITGCSVGGCGSAMQPGGKDASMPGIRGLRYARRKTSVQDVLAFLLAEPSDCARSRYIRH